MDVSDLARHGAKDVVIESYPGARLELPHDRHAGGARALPARAARRDPRRAPRAWPSATPRRSSGSRPRVRRTSPSTRSAPGSPTRCGCRPARRSSRTELMRRLLHDGVADAPRRDGDPPASRRTPRYGGSLPQHRDARQRRLADAPALPGTHRRAAGLRDRVPRDPVMAPSRRDAGDRCCSSAPAASRARRSSSFARQPRGAARGACSGSSTTTRACTARASHGVRGHRPRRRGARASRRRVVRLRGLARRPAGGGSRSCDGSGCPRSATRPSCTRRRSCRGRRRSGRARCCTPPRSSPPT